MDNSHICNFQGVFFKEYDFVLLYYAYIEKTQHLTATFLCRTSGTLGDEQPAKTGPPQITSVVAYSKGFACACGAGLVQLFEKTDDKDFFKKNREIRIPQDPNSSDPSKAENQIIKCLAVSPSEENLVCSTDLNQLYTITVSSADIGKVGLSTPLTYKCVICNSYEA